MIVNVYGKEVTISDKAVEIYEGFFKEPFNDLMAQYMAHSYECDEEMNPSAEEIAYAIEHNIVEHLDLYRGAAEALSKLEVKDRELVVPMREGTA